MLPSPVGQVLPSPQAEIRVKNYHAMNDQFK